MPEEQIEKIWQVSEVTGMVRELLEQSILPLWLTGEIGNLTLHRSGHVYMTLKDASSQIKAVYFNGVSACRALDLRQGSKVEVFGRLSLYPAGGEFQMNVRAIRLCGIGTLQQQFEEMKRRLEAEGLFAPERKRPIPFLCRHIGLITSSSGAAVRDFIKVARRRFPGVEIRICPAPVQGKGAELKLAAALRFFNRIGGVDVIVLTRGGGSLEDLWPFNEEVLARAIANSRIPVVSAVGHEIDFTIADFVADLRAPTPSAAAEMLVPERDAVQNGILQFDCRWRNALSLAFERANRRMDRVQCSALVRRLEAVVSDRRQQIDNAMRTVSFALSDAFAHAEARLEKAKTALALCSPENTVKRGFVILTDRQSGALVTTVGDADAHRHLRAQLSDGFVDVDVVEKK